ncbi:hypothetical protein JCM8208_003117 [Rhodotorula glutinis]
MSPSTSPPSPAPPPPRPPPRASTTTATTRAPFYKLSSLSELELANLSLADMFIGYRPSAIDDADLDLDLDADGDGDEACDFPTLTLGESVVEEAEQRFHERAHEALAFAATPNGSRNNSAAPSALSSPTRTGFFSPSSTSTSSSSSRASLSPAASSRMRPRPAYAPSEAADPSYFALSRASLYSDVDSSYSGSSATTPSLWSAYSPSLSGASSAFTGTPADSAACSPLGPRSPANGLAVPAGAAKKAAPPPPLSLALAQLDLGAAPPQEHDDDTAAPKTATIAARRSGPGALKLSLSLPPLRTSTSSSSLRVQGGSKSPAAPAALSHLSAPSSPSRVGRSGAQSSWVRDLEVRAADVQDGVRLKKKRTGGFAF